MNLKKVFKQTQSKCAACKTNKMKTKSLRRSQNSMFEKNECIDSNFCDFIDSSALKEFEYFDCKIDRTTSYTWVYLLHTKNEWFDILKSHFLFMIKIQTSIHKIKRWKTDWETEIVNKRVRVVFYKNDIIWKFVASYAKKQNDEKKRKNFIVMNAMKVIFIDSKFSFYFWEKILKILVKIKNNESVVRLRVQHMTLYEIYFDVKFDFNHYRLLKCDVWHVIHKNVKNQKKFSDRNIKCKLINYERINQYRFWNSVFRRVIVFKNVEFDESYMLAYFNKTFYWDEDLKFFKTEDIAFSKNDFINISLNDNDDLSDISRLNALIKQSLNFQKIAESPRIEKIEKNFTFFTFSAAFFATFSKSIRDVVDQNDQILHFNSHSDVIYSKISRRSSKVKKSFKKIKLNEQWNKKNSWNKTAAAIIENEYYEKLIAVSQTFYCRQIIVQKIFEENYDHDLNFEKDFKEFIALTKAYVTETVKNLNEEFLTIKEALSEFYKTQHKIALNAKMNAHKKMRIYKRVRLFSLFFDTKILFFRVVFKIKRDLKEIIKKFKTRWCARKFEQKFDVNFTDIYVFVVKSMSYKILFALIVHENLNVEQMNVITAFLNSILKKKIYIWSSKDFEKESWVWLLLRAFYELKQSFRKWYQTFNVFLISQDFQRLNSNHFIFVNKRTRLIVFVYVDDLLIIESKKFFEIAKLKKILNRRFKMFDLKFCSHYLNMKITRDRVNKTFHISQKSYIEKILNKFDMKNCKKIVIFMNVELKLNINESEYQTTVKKIKKYQTFIDSMIYFFTQIRLDIAFAIQKLKRFNLNSTKKIQKVVKKMFRYLQNTKNLNIIYEKENDLIDYTNVDWAKNFSTRKSIEIYLFTLYEDVFSWFFKLQIYVALFFCESEYMTQTQIVKKIVWISRLLKKFDLNYDLLFMFVTMKADNQSAIALFVNFKFHNRIKHIDVQWHFVREMMKKDKMQLKYCSINEMIANELTKSLKKIKFERFVRQVDLNSNIKT